MKSDKHSVWHECGKESVYKIPPILNTNQIVTEDMVHHPAHYTSSNAKCQCGKTIECIDVTRHMDFNIGNAVKYLWRFKHKNGIEDLKKARWYLDDQIKQLETNK